MNDKSEKVLSSKVIYRGRAISLRRDEVVLATGGTSSREIVEHPGAVAIVPVLEDGRVVLIRQFRLAAGGVIWEIPAGTLEAGERPEECARRELEEETGYAPKSLEYLFQALPTPGYSTEVTHFFLAKSLEKRKQRTEEDEFIRVRLVAWKRALRMVLSNEIKDEKTIAAVAYLVAAGKF
jgi:ADP-ribose pyrophosphatase